MSEGRKDELKALHGRTLYERMFSRRVTLSAVFDTPEGDGRAAALAFRAKVQTIKKKKLRERRRMCRVFNEMTFSGPAAV